METTVVVVNVLGWAGMALLISAYALVTAGWLTGTALRFQLMNLFGGAGLMVNSAYYDAWPSAALNLVWVAIGIFGLIRARGRDNLQPVSGVRQRQAAQLPAGLDNQQE